uniref:Uncharacterized protein n=1 Tax=Arundo donax TaxID=35708 RepID=A0A0A9C154_ARUDO
MHSRQPHPAPACSFIQRQHARGQYSLTMSISAVLTSTSSLYSLPWT